MGRDREDSIGNILAERLIAQSLDLPPKAAKVMHCSLQEC